MKTLILTISLFISINSGAQDSIWNDSVCLEPAYIFVDEQASFQDGGIENFRNWMQQNLILKKLEIPSRTTISFIISKTGKLDCIKILRPTGSYLENEIVNLLATCPAWKPARLKGKTVNQQFIMPILIHLSY